MAIPWLPRIDDGVVQLRPLEPRDAHDHLAGEDAQIQRWLSGGVGSMQTVIPWIADRLRDWREAGPRRNFGIRLIAGDGDVLVGNIELNTDTVRMVGMEDGEANIAYAVFPRWRRQGIALRAIELACGYLRDTGLAHTAVIRTEPANTASVGVAGRAGFRADGTTMDDGEELLRFVRVP